MDNHGGADDRRMYGCIYYMNPDHDDAAGGAFVPWRRKIEGVLDDARDLEPRSAVAPRGDRLVVFEADTLAHSVEAYRDDAYRRYALTVWILADEDGAIPRRDGWRPLSPTATHAGMADVERGGG